MREPVVMNTSESNGTMPARSTWVEGDLTGYGAEARRHLRAAQAIYYMEETHPRTS